MASIRPLAHAPVTEAIFDIRVKAAAAAGAEQLRAAHVHLANAFPRVEDRRTVQIHVPLEYPHSEPQRQDLGLQGYFFRSADNLEIAQFRLDGFTFNRLAPYTSWDALMPRVLRCWEVYRQAAAPVAIVRLAVRYLNRVALSPAMRDMAEYLAAPPAVPPELPQELSGFLSRMTLHEPGTELTANIAQSLDVDPIARAVSLILDIEVFDQVERSPDAPIEELLAGHRKLKNRAFFGLLTEKALEDLA